MPASALCFTDGVLNYNQDSHRQRTVDWCDATGSTAAAFGESGTLPCGATLWTRLLQILLSTN